GRIVDILAASPDLAAGKALLGVLQEDVPEEVRNHVLNNLKLFLPTKWKDLRQGGDLDKALDKLLSKAERRAVAVALIGAAKRLDLLDKLAGSAGDAKDAGAVRGAAVQALGSLSSDKAVTALKDLLEVDPPTLRVEVVKSLGKLAGQTKAGKTGAPEALK